MDEPWALVVGKPFSEKRNKWIDGSFEYRYWSGNHLLQLCFSSPSQKDIEAFSSGRVDVGLYIEANVIFWLFRIERLMDWSDQGFSIRLLSEAEQFIPPMSDDGRIPLNLVLVDADTGLVSALRMVTYSPHFTRLFYRAIQRQKDAEFDHQRHADTVAAIYKRYPNSKDLVRSAVVVERAGARTP
jgi:hypothetical protein